MPVYLAISQIVNDSIDVIMFLLVLHKERGKVNHRKKNKEMWDWDLKNIIASIFLLYWWEVELKH